MLRLALAPPLVALAALTLTAALLVLSASGHFPRRPGKDGDPGAPTLWLSLLCGLAATAIGVVAAWRLLPLPHAVIAAGLGILAGPLVLQYFPDRFVDGRGALATFGGCAILLALVLTVLGG